MKFLFQIKLYITLAIFLLSGFVITKLDFESTTVAAQEITSMLPKVAIHVSELTQVLETIPAGVNTPQPPAVPTASGFEWWYTSWHYFVMPESLKEALNADGTPYEVVTDADIMAGNLLNADGSPRYPILISLAAEVIHDAEIAFLRDYVNSGGFLFVGSSSFTRNPDGTTRGNFALSTEMGLAMQNNSLENRYINDVFTKIVNNRIVAHIPSGTLNWYLPLKAEEIPLGTVANRDVHQEHYAWAVNATDAEVLANGSSGPLVATKKYGDGRFFYYGILQPLIGVGGNDGGMYTYLIFRRAIEWAFESANLPIVKISPWRYEYDSAFMVRHDFENDANSIQSIESFAQTENMLGIRGEYYFCTGVLRIGSEDPQLTDPQKQAAIESLQRAVSMYGTIIGSHNGGLANPVNPGLAPSNYNYWHWGPDEAFETTPSGYPDGQTYAFDSIETSFLDIEDWFSGLDNGRPGCGVSDDCPRLWASPYFNSGRDDSFVLLENLEAITMGEQKISPFPHWTVSTATDGGRFSHISIPVSTWYVDADTAQSLEQHTDTTMQAGVDFYHENGFLVNFYSHGSSANYSSYVSTKSRSWSTNSVDLYDWWLERSPVVVTPSFEQNGDLGIVTATISNATDPDTAIELVIPYWNLDIAPTLQVNLNGMAANPDDYRITDNGIKIKVGNSVTDVEVQYEDLAPCTDPLTCDPVDAISSYWRCDIPGCNYPDWTGSVISWPSWSAYSNNDRSGDQSRTVYSTEGDLLYPYMGSWAEGCQITAVSGTAIIIEWERGSDTWRETWLDPGESHTITLVPPEDGALIEGSPAGFSISISNCNPQSIIPDQYTITTNIVGQGTIEKDPNQETYLFGEVITLTAIADPGWSFDSWSGDLITTTNPYSDIIIGNAVVTATFTQDQYSLTLHTLGSGSVVPDPAPGPYHYNDVVTLTADAAPGWSFSGWSGDIISSTNPFHVTIFSDTVITATFIEIPPTCYALTLTHSGQGSNPIANPTNSTGCSLGKYVEGETISLSGALPDTGWQIIGWTGTSQDDSTKSTNSLIMPAIDHIVNIEYRAYIYLPIIVGGTISNEPILSYENQEEKLSATTLQSEFDDKERNNNSFYRLMLSINKNYQDYLFDKIFQIFSSIDPGFKSRSVSQKLIVYVLVKLGRHAPTICETI